MAKVLLGCTLLAASTSNTLAPGLLLPCANVTNRTECGNRCQPLTLAAIRPRSFEVTACERRKSHAARAH